MKVNVFEVFTNLLAICAVLNCVFLSAAAAAQLPLSDEAKSTEIVSTISSLNETVSNVTTASSVEKSNPSENASVEESSSTDTMPPLVFPSEDTHSPKNDTALKILQSVSGEPSEKATTNETSNETTLPATAENATTTVLPTTMETIANSTNETTGNSTVKEFTEDDYDNMSEESEKTDAENIQESTNEQQGDLEEEFGKNGSDKATINVFEDPITNEPALHNGHVALIFASTLVVFSVLAYVGLILWRGRLETRYGMRQRLVTEDDYYNNNDVRYFGL